MGVSLLESNTNSKMWHPNQ